MLLQGFCQVETQGTPQFYGGWINMPAGPLYVCSAAAGHSDTHTEKGAPPAGTCPAAVQAPGIAGQGTRGPPKVT